MKKTVSVTTNPSNSPLTLGNHALREGKYAEAIAHYEHAAKKTPELERVISGNIEIARRKSKPIPRTTSIDIVVPVFNALEDVKRCLESLEKHTDGYRVQVIVVNDGSDAATTHWLRQHCQAETIFTLIENTKNLGYTRAVNSGLRKSHADYVITQNSDTIVTAGWLQGMVCCMQSDPKIGIVGPLSNAASWQNVPKLRDDSGSFAINTIPNGLDFDDMARLVALSSLRKYPRLPFINGFCFMIRRAVIDNIGYMDEENFPVGYGEENDFCIRTMDAGYELAIADDVYVFHAKSKSFGHERRKVLSEQGTINLKLKHGAQKYGARVEAVKCTEALDAIRARISEAVERSNASSNVDLMNMRILFLLPVKGGGGGAHSVVQEVTEMRRLGLYAQVGVKHEQIEGFFNAYADINGSREIFLGFDDNSLIEAAESFDIVVGTIFSSMKLVKRIATAHPHVLPAYYVQDYEPMFFSENSPQWREACESYTLVKGAFLFAKTQWIIDKVKREHDVLVYKVQPSIDHDVYKPIQRANTDRLNVSAMIRPQTPYRGAERTMRVLARLHKLFGDRLSIHLFGCENEDSDFQKLDRGFSFVNHGPLLRPQVATILAQSDLFIDLSDYQAFGRTALEAMACGCAAVVPNVGGSHEYAVHGQNALVLNTFDEAVCVSTIAQLLKQPADLQRLRRNGLLTAARYSVHAAAVSEAIPLEAALKARRVIHPRLEKPVLYLLPSLRGDNLPTGSGYVRVALPYTSPTVLQEWRVHQTRTLPKPGSGLVALIQREAIGHSLAELKEWLPGWKAAGGKLLYEIDDDLLDAEGLRARHHTGDLEATVTKVSYLASNADLVHVSTPSLARRLQVFNQHVRIIPNALDSDLWRLSRQRQHDHGPFRRLPAGPVRIGYIGTPTHDEDLELISEAMREIEVKYGSAVEIEIIGGFQKRKPTFGKRVALPKKNDYPNFVHWLQERVHWDIGIIPLATTPFNDSKSHLKFLEYAALDMAIVVSQGSTYSTVAKDGDNCIVTPASKTAWINAVSTLIEKPDLRMNYAKKAGIELITQHTLSVLSTNVVQSLRTLIPHQ